MAITTILFDLGGVVCRFQPQRRLAALAAASDLSPDEVRARIWDSGFDAECDRGRFTARGIHERVMELIGLRMSYDDFRAAWALAFEPDPDVLAVVDALRPRVRTALLTDNGPVLLDAMPLIFPDIARRFNPLLFSCALGALKPSRALFDAALARLREPKEAVLLVDDSPRVVEGARSYGLAAVRFTGAAALAGGLAPYL